MADAQQIFARIEKIAQGAALMTETRQLPLRKACSSYLPNRTLEAAMYQAVCHYGTPPGARKSALCRNSRHPERERYQ
jgi:aminobenzoyl-glutamate utilization protein B